MELGAPEIQIAVSLVVVLGTAFIALVCDFLKGNNEQLRERNIELRAREDERTRLGLNQPLQWLQSLAALIRQPAAEPRSAEAAAPVVREPELTVPAAAPVEAEPEAPTAWATREELEQLAGRAARLRSRQEPPAATPVATAQTLAALSPIALVPEPLPEPVSETETEPEATPAPVLEMPVARDPEPPGGGGLPLEEPADVDREEAPPEPTVEAETVAEEVVEAVEPAAEPVADPESEPLAEPEPVVTSYATAWQPSATEPVAEQTPHEESEFFRPSWAAAVPLPVEPVALVPETPVVAPEAPRARVLSISIASPEREERAPLELESELRRVAEPEPSVVPAFAVLEAEPVLEDVAVSEPEPANVLPAGLQAATVLGSLMEQSAPFSGVAVAIGINDFETLREKLKTQESLDALGPVTMMVQSLLRSQDMACRFLDDEYILLFPGETGSAAQRRLFQISEKLWDFQLRSLGNLAMMFSWGGLELNAEPLAEGVAAARERMYQTRRNRKPTASSPLARRRVVNG